MYIYVCLPLCVCVCVCVAEYLRACMGMYSYASL